jgi:hypothetical protein
MMYLRFKYVLISVVLFSTLAQAGGGLDDLLKDALKDYVEKKSEKIKSHNQSDTEDESFEQPTEVVLYFSGAQRVPPDVFARLGGSSTTQSPSSTGSSTGNAKKPMVIFTKPVLTTYTALQPPLAESDCYKYVQGNIPWDLAGKNKNWNKANVKRLCKGTTSKYSPGNCFRYVMFKGSSWGKKAKHKVNWNKAIDLCEGISNNRDVTTCFKNAIAAGKSLDRSIKLCEKKGG